MFANAASLAGPGIVAASACLAGLAPQGLLAEDLRRGPGWRSGLVLALAAGVVGVAVYVAFAAQGRSDIGWSLGVAAACLVAIAVVDARVLLIPDLHVLALALLAFVGPLALGLPTALAGALVGGGLLWAVAAVFRRWRGVVGLGFGDVKLMAAVGALSGPVMVLWIIVAAAMLGVIWALARNGWRMQGAPATPFGAAAALPAIALLAIERLGR